MRSTEVYHAFKDDRYVLVKLTSRDRPASTASLMPQGSYIQDAAVSFKAIIPPQSRRNREEYAERLLGALNG
jgi:hypothetical protein